ncbi:MAG: type II secretion system protein M [Acidobacteria bacterium]|nr:type II secretion system protein M [Acidobacteriota bacterium]
MSLWRRVLSERRVLVVPLLTVLAINVLVLALAVFPLQRSVAGDEDRANDVKLALADARRTERVANDTRLSKQRADEELKRFYAEVLPASHAVARDLLYLQVSKLSREHGLKFESSSFEPEPVDGSSLMRFRVDVSLTGDYANIRKFLYRIETAEEFYIIEGVKLGQASRTEGGTALEVVLQVATYYSGAAR